MTTRSVSEKYESPFGRMMEKAKEGVNNAIRQVRDDPFAWGVIFFVVAIFTFFLIIPLLQIIVLAFYFDGNFTFQTFRNIFSNPFFFNPGNTSEYFMRIDTGNPEYTVISILGPDYGVFLNTIFIGIFTTFFSLIIGTVTAFLMARVEFRGKTILGGLLLLPLILPPFVSGVGFFAILGPEQGLLNTHVFTPLFGFRLQIQGLIAIIFVQTGHYFTLIYLNVYSALANADPSLEESAENLGASRLRVTRTVTLPLALPGIASGSILVLILAMEDLGTPIIFTGFSDPIAPKTIPYYIFSRFFVGTAGETVSVESAILSFFLLVFAIIGFLAIRKYVGLRNYSTTGKGKAGEFRLLGTSILVKVLIYLYFLGLLFVALIPHIGILMTSFFKPQSFKFTFEYYRRLFDVQTGFGSFIVNTLTYAGFATLLIVIIATLAGYVASRKKFPGQTLFDTLITLPIAIPGIVIGIGYIRTFTDSPSLGQIGNINLTLDPIAYPVLLLIISFTIRKFPFTVRSVYAGLQQSDPVLEEAAQNLGASRSRIIIGIIIPIVVLNIVAGALISLVYNMSEVSTSVLFISDQQYGTVTWKMAEAQGELLILAPMGVFLMIIQSISLITTNVLLRNRAEALTGI